MFIEQFAGTDSSVVDDLGDMVLSGLDEHIRALILRISLFDRISAPLAQDLGGADNAEELLAALRARNLFLNPLDRTGTWVRLHHLAGEFFRERFRRSAPAQAMECLLRGATWLHVNGNVEEVINCAIRAQEWDRATRWIAECVEEFAHRRGYHQTILRWMNALPDEWVDRHPAIRMQYPFSLSFYPRQHEYEAQIHRLRSALADLQNALAVAAPRQHRSRAGCSE